MRPKPFTILVLDDDNHDIFFVTRAILNVNPLTHVQAVNNGEEAIRYLNGEEPYHDRLKFPLPHLILTDLKMPGIDGLEFLHWRQKNHQWALIPTIMLSGSGLEKDVRTAYKLGANSYFTKPCDLTKLAGMVRMILEYWTAAHSSRFR